MLVMFQILRHVLNLNYWCYTKQTLSRNAILILVNANSVLSHGHVAMFGIAKDMTLIAVVL